jgi:hypothetical protein
MVEDESDVQAAKELKAEVKADYAEFDENAPDEIEDKATQPDEGGGGSGGENTIKKKQENEMNRVEKELRLLENEV